MTPFAIRVEGLGKQYQIGARTATYGSLRESLVDVVRAPLRRARQVWRGASAADLPQTIWALRDVSFDVQPGEVVGIIGRNGAGKSTLLKILARITPPSTGRASIYGKVGALLEVGTGFHSELTGRENVYLNGSILGLPRREITRQFEAITDFADLDAFIDTPVKFYSSGMILRLGFAVAAHLEPEILIVDEVLAVGDAAFQRKCLAVLEDRAHSSRTVLFVSHNMGAVMSLCTRALLLEKGELRADGGVQAVIQTYLAAFAGAQDSLLDAYPQSGQKTRILGFSAAAEDSISEPRTAAPARFTIRYESDEPPPLAKLFLSIGVKDALGVRLFTCTTAMTKADFYNAPVQGVVTCLTDFLPLIPGRYTADLKLITPSETIQLENAAHFTVIDGGESGVTQYPRAVSMFVPHRWEISGT